MRVARYRARVAAHWPGWVKDWLTTPGSLTVRLQQRAAFKVEPVVQHVQSVLADEARYLGLQRRQHVRTRNVRLWNGGQVVVVAHTVVKVAGARCDWPFWKNLGQRSLGTVLFRDKTVRRLPLEFARIQTGPPLHPGQPWPALYARRTRYDRRCGATPLIVTEVFLPVLQDLPIMPPS